jgi:hypothetical protein
MPCRTRKTADVPPALVTRCGRFGGTCRVIRDLRKPSYGFISHAERTPPNRRARQMGRLEGKHSMAFGALPICPNAGELDGPASRLSG